VVDVAADLGTIANRRTTPESQKTTPEDRWMKMTLNVVVDVVVDLHHHAVDHGGAAEDVETRR